KRTMDVGELEHQLEKGGVVCRLAAHRNDNRINLVFLEVRIVNHWRFEALGRIAEMSNELGSPADRHANSPILLSGIPVPIPTALRRQTIGLRTHFASELSSKCAIRRSANA